MANPATDETTESKRPRASVEDRRFVSVVPDAGAERKRRMSEIIARVAYFLIADISHH